MTDNSSGLLTFKGQKGRICPVTYNCGRPNGIPLSRYVMTLLKVFFSVALQSLKDLGCLTYRRLLELFRHMVGLLGRAISLSQGLCLHRTTQHTKTWTNIHALSGIRTHDPSNQPAKTHTSDHMVTVTGIKRFIYLENKILLCLM
jgi:hypothetical protein